MLPESALMLSSILPDVAMMIDHLRSVVFNEKAEEKEGNH